MKKEAIEWNVPHGGRERTLCNGLYHRVSVTAETVAEEVFHVRHVVHSIRLLLFHIVINSSPVYKTEINDRMGSAALTTRHPLYPQKLALNFVDKWRSSSRYSSLAD
jgi:hypothetical protein